MRNMPSSSSSWMDHKEQAKQAYQRVDYESALTSYCAALHPDLYCPADERQLLLSNMVACRLKIGGFAQAEAAVENAKQCVAVNDQWAKGHVRLASAYIALGGHSNDACNELQRAIQLDPGNPAARQMLIRELRRDHTHDSRSNHPQTSVDPSELDDIDATPAPTQNAYFDVDDQNVRSDNPSTWQENLQLYYTHAKNWYFAQSNDKRTVIKVFVVIVCLYVAFGGRFGLAGGQVQRRGNYHAGNVYDQYHDRRTASTTTTSHSDSHQDYSLPNKDYSSYREPPTTRRSSTSFQFPNMFDGSIQSMLVLSGIGYLCHRNGINPMQALFFLNMIGGRGGGRRYRPGFGGGFARRRWR